MATSRPEKVIRFKRSVRTSLSAFITVCSYEPFLSANQRNTPSITSPLQAPLAVHTQLPYVLSFAHPAVDFRFIAMYSRGDGEIEREGVNECMRLQERRGFAYRRKKKIEPGYANGAGKLLVKWSMCLAMSLFVLGRVLLFWEVV